MRLNLSTTTTQPAPTKPASAPARPKAPPAPPPVSQPDPQRSPADRECGQPGKSPCRASLHQAI
jgi:hypothetical protein